MKFIIKLFFLPPFILAVITALTISVAWASGEHTHDDEHSAHEEATAGERGGRLFIDDSFSLEVAINESGTDPEFRVWSYFDGKPLAPEEVTLTIDLARLGGETDTISFHPEADYLVSDQSIKEPHSFDVTLNAQRGGEKYNWQFESYEGRTQISERAATLAEVVTDIAGAATLQEKITLFGRIRLNEESIFTPSARYPGLVTAVRVSEGDVVTKGQILANIEARETLQNVSVVSPTAGIVTARHINVGSAVDSNALFEITNTDKLWLELDAFPKDLPHLAEGQPVFLQRNAKPEAVGRLTYISPSADIHTRSTLARAVIDNDNHSLHPGLLINAEVEINKREVPVAVRATAIQRIRDRDVVFVQHDDTYEIRMINTGTNDGEWVEVLSGLEAGTRYVTENSFLVKADILKSGARHAH